MYKQRSSEELDSMPQARFVKDFPIKIGKVWNGSLGLSKNTGDMSAIMKGLEALWVVEMMKIIVHSVAGRTLAAHRPDIHGF